MKATKFLTLILIFNWGNAITRNWTPTSKNMVIINAIAVLSLVAIQFIFRKKERE